MASKKKTAKDKLIDKTFGSSNGKMTSAWQKILEEPNNDFQELNEMLKKDKEKNAEPKSDELYVDSKEDQINFSSPRSVSSHSIQPGPITLTSDLKRLSYDSGMIDGNPTFTTPGILVLSTCCLSAQRKERLRYNEASKKIKLCNGHISHYFHHLKANFEALEALLKFAHPLSSNLPGTNLASAQLWFITFGLCRIITHLPQLDRQSTVFFRSKFKILLNYAQRLSSEIAVICAVTARIAEKGFKNIRVMKESLTGSSTSDLANSENTAIDDIFVDCTSLTELAHITSARWNQFHPQQEPHFLRTTSNLFHHLDNPDSLRDRRQMDIFVKNVTKAGWANYEDVFTIEKRMRVLRTLLIETLDIIAKTIGICGKIKRRLIAGGWSKAHASFRFGHTFLPWLRDTKAYVKFCVKMNSFGPTEHEFVRFHIYAAEIRLKGLIQRAEQMKLTVGDITEVATLSCDLLEKKHQLLIPHYAEVRNRFKIQTREKLPVTEDSVVTGFYLHGYGNVLKEVPITFRISRFILARKVLAQERHSGVDFGLRFFTTSQNTMPKRK